MIVKICHKCGMKKSFKEFYKDKSRKDGYTDLCKFCKIIQSINYANKHKEERAIYKKQRNQRIILKNKNIIINSKLKKPCNKCGQVKRLSEFNKDRKRVNGISGWCKMCCCELHKIWRAKNKDRIKKQQYTPHRIYGNLKSRIKKGEIISEIDFINWYNSQEQKCYYCERTLEEVKNDIKEKEINQNRMSIDRKDNDKGYILNNIVFACRRCNEIKSDYFTETEMLRLGKILYKNDKNIY